MNPHELDITIRACICIALMGGVFCLGYFFGNQEKKERNERKAWVDLSRLRRRFPPPRRKFRSYKGPFNN